jgi:V/A-type H+-transporting ATPase subunit I
VIGRMEKLLMAGPKQLAPTILLNLQRAGVVQIDPLRTDEISGYRLSQDEEVRLGRWDKVTGSADHGLKLLGLEPDPSVQPFARTLEEAEAAVSPYEQRAAALVEKRERLRDELELIDQYREVVEALAELGQGLDGSRWLAVLAFVQGRRAHPVPLDQELASALGGLFLLARKPVGGRMAAVIVVLKRDAEEARGVLSHQGLAELPRAGEYAGMSLKAMASRLRERSRLAPQELAALEEELSRMAKEAAAGLQGICSRAKDESVRFHTLREMASGRYGFALFGWVPVSLKSRVVEVMDRFHGQILHTFEPVDEHHEAARVPVMLENPGWVKPFESLVSFLNTPRYDGRDPTWAVAVFFPLWFGMIVGDIGYAMTFAAVSGYLSRYIRSNRTMTVDFFNMRLSPRALKRLVQVMRPMILWTFFWGFLHGEFFGNLLQRLGIFGTGGHAGLLPILIPRTDTATTATGLILVSIGFGVYQVLYGFYLKASLAQRRGEKKHFWEASAFFSGVAALILFAYSFMTEDFGPWLLAPTVAGGVLFFAGMIRVRMPLMIAELPTQGGHILSYIRIYAVGLVSAILADLATDMGYSLYHSLGIAGFVLGVAAGIVAALLMHAFLVALLTVSHVLQPIRLIWVEFFTKFDFYAARGRPYRPFKSIYDSPR